MEPTAFWSSDGEVAGRRDMAGNWPSEWGAIVRRTMAKPKPEQIGLIFACGAVF
jgi:hypothetical protein